MVAPGLAARHDQALEAELAVVDQIESMGWMMTVSVLQQTGYAEVIIVTIRASDHLRFIKIYSKLGPLLFSDT